MSRRTSLYLHFTVCLEVDKKYGGALAVSRGRQEEPEESMILLVKTFDLLWRTTSAIDDQDRVQCTKDQKCSAARRWV